MFGRKRDVYTVKSSHMTDEEKKEYIATLESDREAVVLQIEELMRDIADASGKRRLGKKRKR